MNEQDKQLLLKDLCGRLTYWTECCYMDDEEDRFTLSIVDNCGYVNESYPIEDVKPFLRPMSSMTEGEKKEYRKTQYKEVIVQYPCTAAPNDVEIWCSTASTYDYLNSIHVDYRGLIENGLALPAPEEMYNFKS